ncbi:MAG: glycosyltransferase [Candidatus Tectomicrobia bacterium]|nr:glycosyltransferase [Candidatus Tectomicrobia bacterium]
MPIPEVSIIIVNWNTRGELLRCLASVRQCAAAIPHELLVVDNGSTDGSVEAILATYPETTFLSASDASLPSDERCDGSTAEGKRGPAEKLQGSPGSPSWRLYRNNHNVGFARAFNFGLALARGRSILALNPDCELRAGALERLLQALEALPDAGILTPTLVDQEGRQRHSYSSFPTLLTEGFSKAILQWLLPRRYPSKRRRYHAPLAVDSAIGACMLVRRQAIEAVGPLDEAFFLYLEETDWCYRMRQAGWRCYYLPDAVVMHGVGQAARRVPVQSRLEFFRSRYRYFEKHASAPARQALILLLLLRLALGVAAQGIGTFATVGLVPRLRRRLSRNVSLLAWHLRGCPAGWGLRPEPPPAGRALRGDERLLVVKLGSLGDVLHALPAAAALKRTYPALRIAWAVEAAHAALLQGQDCIDEVFCLETRAWRRRPLARRTWAAVAASCRRLAAWQCEVALDLQGLYKSALVLRLSGAARRIGLGRLREPVGWAYTERVPMPTWNEHAVDRYLRVATYLGAKVEEVPFPLPEAAPATNEATTRLLATPGAGNPDRPLVILHVGAGKAANIWFPERYRQLADRLARELGVRIAFTGSAAERGLVASIRRPMQQPSLDLSGATSLPELVNLLRHAALCVAGDTGPAHLAAALGCPVVSIFGPANPQRTAPYRGATVLYDPPPCSPCYRRTYCSHMTCFQRLTVETVFTACRERLLLGNVQLDANLPHQGHHLDRA